MNTKIFYVCLPSLIIEWRNDQNNILQNVNFPKISEWIDCSESTTVFRRTFLRTNTRYVSSDEIRIQVICLLLLPIYILVWWLSCCLSVATVCNFYTLFIFHLLKDICKVFLGVYDLSYSPFSGCLIYKFIRCLYVSLKNKKIICLATLEIEKLCVWWRLL